MAGSKCTKPQGRGCMTGRECTEPQDAQDESKHQEECAQSLRKSVHGRQSARRVSGKRLHSTVELLKQG